MVGFITERELIEADEAFPGIKRFFESLRRKPRTFLNLMAIYEKLVPGLD
jgi:hypothetical protein